MKITTSGTFGAVVTGILIAVLAVVGLAAISSLFLMLGWNVAMVEVFGLPHISLLQAFCLSLVAHVLVKPNSSSKSKE